MTEDVVIIGYDPPEQLSKKKGSEELSITKYAKLGWIGAVRFGQYRNGKLEHCGSMSGMTDAMRKEFSEHGEKYVGTVCSVLANEREEDTGKFRHPRWCGFRKDKKPTECIWDQSGTYGG